MALRSPQPPVLDDAKTAVADRPGPGRNRGDDDRSCGGNPSAEGRGRPADGTGSFRDQRFWLALVTHADERERSKEYRNLAGQRSDGIGDDLQRGGGRDPSGDDAGAAYRSAG